MDIHLTQLIETCKTVEIHRSNGEYVLTATDKEGVIYTATNPHLHAVVAQVFWKVSAHQDERWAKVEKAKKKKEAVQAKAKKLGFECNFTVSKTCSETSPVQYSSYAHLVIGKFDFHSTFPTWNDAEMEESLYSQAYENFLMDEQQ
jgi:hypothetical protein